MNIIAYCDNSVVSTKEKKLKKLTALIIILVCSVLCISCTENSKKVKLSFKYKKGMKLEYKQESKRLTKVFKADSLINNESDESIAFINQEVLDVVDDSTFKMNEVDTWHYTQPNKDDSTQFDSVTYSREMELLVLQNGKILDFTSKDADQKTTSYLKNYYEQGLPIFPSVDVYPGYSWTQTTSVVLPSETMKASTTYSIKSFVRELGYDCAVIEYTGNLLIPIEPKEEDKTQRSGLDKIHTDGMIYFAYSEGIVIKQTEKWNTVGERIQLVDNEWERYNFTSQYDVNFGLVKVDGLK